ncbi:hypothetical protein PYDG_00032 [Pseudoalteromonas phage pYD6-A]|uniref:Uncharacterized protein n=1 Tax=Pseudoalteromonas phage pYD6-A TaxID=754052 RepID=M4T3W6_9CAUD|nr:hypothetical protein PYDG_00032 [Pseudoalteromonas phage pYD6-A]AGH57564.1 hypothetical protein PYDG_00032 [Pseudoalteromonas phage pYD6-A]
MIDFVVEAFGFFSGAFYIIIGGITLFILGVRSGYKFRNEIITELKQKIDKQDAELSIQLILNKTQQDIIKTHELLDN